MTTVTGTIGGNSIAGYVRSLHRTHHICDPGQTGTLVLLNTFPNAIATSDEVEISEQGVLVFTGYVQRFTRERPSHDYKIELVDTYTRVTNYFITDKLTTGFDSTTDQPVEGYTPLTVDYWIGYLCGLCGISYSIDTSTGGKTVPQGTQIGLRTVHDSLVDVACYASLGMFVSPSGVLHFKRIIRNVPTYTFTQGYELQDSTSDEWTRNVIKVFGGYSWGNRKVFSSASTTVDGLIVDHITAVASPYIQDQATADELANFLISELGAQSRVVSLKMEGDPTVKLGYAARINIRETDHTDAISSLDFRWDEHGYTTDVTIGERCPRIAGWSTSLTPVYAGTSAYGVYKSTDSGATWAEYNGGLPAGTKYVKRLAFNALDGAGVAIINNALWWTDGSSGSWTARTLPAPINMAGDSPAVGYGSLVAVSANGVGFDVLTTNTNNSSGSVQQARSWVYSSADSSGSSWTSTQLQDTSGSGFHIVAYDIASPYVIASSGSLFVGEPIIYRGDFSRMGVLTDLDTSERTCGDFGTRGLLDYHITGSRLEGTAPDRHLYVDFYFDWTDADLAYINFYYRPLTIEAYNANAVGPFIVSGPFPVVPELYTPASPPWPSDLTFHAATLDISENELPGLGISGQFAIAFMTLAGSRVDASHRWTVVNGEPRTCSQWIAENPDADSITRYYTTGGYIVYEFPA